MPFNVSPRGWPARLAIAAGLAVVALTTVAPPASAAEDLTWEALVRELFARQRGNPATKADWAGMLALDAHKERVKSVALEAYAFLTDTELKAIGVARGDGKAGGLRRSARRGEWETRKEAEARTQSMRTMPVFAQGLLADLMAINGCRPTRSTAFAAGDVKYLPDGRPKAITVMQAQLTRECQAFVRSAIVLTVASLDYPVVPEAADRVMVLFEPALLACADDPFAPSQPRGADLAFEFPKLTREPNVEYPDALRKRGMPDQVVALGVQVSHTGCVSSAKTLRSVLPIFDLAAIQSMFTAKWASATLGGEPVNAYVTFNVLFTLR